MTTAERVASLRAEHAAEDKANADEHRAEIKALQLDALLNGTESVEQTLKDLGISGTAGMPIILEVFTTLKTQKTDMAAQVLALEAEVVTLNEQIAELNAQLNP